MVVLFRGQKIDQPCIEGRNEMDMFDQINKEKVDENHYAEKKQIAIGKKKKKILETINFVRSDSEQSSDSDEPEEEPVARLAAKCSQKSSQDSIPPRDKKGLSSRVVGISNDESFAFSGQKKISKKRRKEMDQVQQQKLNRMNSFYEELDEEELTFA